MLNKIVLVGHIWLPHFPFSLARGRSQAYRRCSRAGNSVLDDHRGHCHQVRAPFSSKPSQNQLCQALCQPQWDTALPGQAAVPEHTRVSKLSCLTHHQTWSNTCRKERTEKSTLQNNTSSILHQLTPAMKQLSSSLHLHFLLAPGQQHSLLPGGASAAAPGPQRTPKFGQDRA